MSAKATAPATRTRRQTRTEAPSIRPLLILFLSFGSIVLRSRRAIRAPLPYARQPPVGPDGRKSKAEDRVHPPDGTGPKGYPFGPKSAEMGASIAKNYASAIEA